MERSSIHSAANARAAATMALSCLLVVPGITARTPAGPTCAAPPAFLQHTMSRCDSRTYTLQQQARGVLTFHSRLQSLG